MGRSWQEAESDLREGWSRYERRGSNPRSWEDVRDAVKDAWERVAGGSTAEAEESRPEPRE
jgi:hypothetical protein